MVTTRQQLAPTTKTYKGENTTDFLTIHETGNPAAGATAAMHANLQSNGNPGRAASWHWQVDDKEAVQSFLPTAQCWHSGKGRDLGNTKSVAVEICINTGADWALTIENAAQLSAKIMAEEGIPMSNVVQHNKWSGKDCPTRLRHNIGGISWDTFLGKVAAYAGYGTPTQPAPPVVTPPVNPPAKDPNWIDEDGLWGGDTNGLIQLRAGTVQDRELWGQVKSNAQPAFVGGWVYNYPTVKGSPAWAWAQGRLHTAQDGIFGQNDLRALEARAGFPYDGRLDKPSATVKWLQHALNTNTL